MAERQGGLPQVIDADFLSRLIREVPVVGPLGVVNVSDVLVPMFFVGQSVPFEVALQTPAFGRGEWVGGDLFTNVAAGAVLADSGQLAAGDYDVVTISSAEMSTTFAQIEFQWRNAANAANIQVFTHLSSRTTTGGATVIQTTYALEGIALNERFRFVDITALAANDRAAGAIMFKRRA